MHILCRCGFHSWEKEPSHREKIKATGIDFFFFSTGIQKGIRKCTRKGCDATQKVTREGIVGNGGKAGNWEKLSPERERHIDSLPVM